MSAGFSINWKKDLRKKVDAAVQDAAVAGLSDAAEMLLQEANKTAPHSQGPLRLSGATSTDASKPAAAVSYDTPYARRQHEDTRLRHPDPTNLDSNPRGRAKWLQLAMQENQGRLQRYVAAKIRDAT